MDITELKCNHVVQIREKGKTPITCLVINIGKDFVDVETVENNKIKMINHVDINKLFPIDIFDAHVLALGFNKEEKFSITDYIVYSYKKNGKEIYIVKRDRFHLLRKNEGTNQYEIENKLLTLHELQNEMSTYRDLVDAVDKSTFTKLSQRYQVTILTPTITT